MSTPKNNKGYTAPQLKRGIIKDPISAKDFNSMKLIYACEHCSFFDPQNTTCAMGHNPTQHLKKSQLHTYNVQGKMAFCRNLEID